MYNPHRAQQGPPIGGRLGELLEQVKAEFDAQAHRSNDYDQQCECRSSDAKARVAPAEL